MSRRILGWGVIAPWMSPMETHLQRTIGYDLYWDLYHQVTGPPWDGPNPLFLMVHRELRSCDE